MLLLTGLNEAFLHFGRDVGLVQQFWSWFQAILYSSCGLNFKLFDSLAPCDVSRALCRHIKKWLWYGKIGREKGKEDREAKALGKQARVAIFSIAGSSLGW